MHAGLAVLKRTALSFYNDQMTHHAAALTYYGLMSLFPTLLLALYAQRYLVEGLSLGAVKG